MEQNKLLCSHPKVGKIKNDSLHTFCVKCGIIVLKTEKGFTYLAKPSKYERNIEFDPLEHFNSMKKSIVEWQNDNGMLSAWYINHRKQALMYLYRLIEENLCQDSIFYTAATYLDSILEHGDECSETKLDLTVISCFLLALKFADNDPYVPDISNILASNGKFRYNSRDVKQYEERTLKLLQYKLDSYTPYDVLLFLLNCGIIFKDELTISKQPADLLNSVYTLTTQLLAAISTTPIFLSHNPIQIAFAVIYMARRHFHLDKEFRKKITKFYQIPFKYFAKCVTDVKNFCLENKNKILGMKKEQNVLPPQSQKHITPKYQNYSSYNLNEIGIGTQKVLKNLQPSENLTDSTIGLNYKTNDNPKSQITVPNSLCSSSISTAQNSLYGSNTKMKENKKVFLPQSSKDLKCTAYKKSFDEVKIISIKNKISDQDIVYKNINVRNTSILPCINEKK